MIKPDKYAHLSEEERNQRHNHKMAKKKIARDKILATNHRKRSAHRPHRQGQG